MDIIKRVSMICVLSLLVVAFAVSPVSGDQGVSVLTGGLMEVGDDFAGGEVCAKNVTPQVEGRGLAYPAVKPKPADHDLVYRFVFPATPPAGLIPESFTWVYVNDSPEPSVAFGRLSLCGFMTQVLGGPAVGGASLGPWCGMHKGYNGKGKLSMEDGDDGEVRHWQLSDVAWKGTILRKTAVLGKVRYQNTGPGGSKGNKLFRWGQHVALLDLGSDPGFTNQNCLNAATGGTRFTVNGVMSITSLPGGNKSDVVEWNDNFDGDTDRNDDPIFCKGSFDSDNNGSKESACPLYPVKPRPPKPKDT